MIIQSLDALYGQLLADPEVDIPRAGFSTAKVHYALVLNPEGELVTVQNLQQRSGKKVVASQLVVPEQDTRTSGVKAYVLCDKTAYVLGADEGKGKAAKLAEQFNAFKALHAAVTGDSDDVGLQAVSKFLAAWTPDRAAALPDWADLAGKNVVFKLDGEQQFVHERPAARQAWLRYRHAREAGVSGFCLARGERGPIAALHPNLKGVRGAQTSGAYLVSFNQNAFTSYGKEQNYNAPVCEDAAFAYTTALNHLLRDDKQRVQIGDATTVYWTARPAPVALALFGATMGGGLGGDLEQDEEDPDATSTPPSQDAGLLHLVRLVLEAFRDGKTAGDLDADLDEPNIPFYILGLSPNNARLAVRFWHVSTVGEITARLGQHFQDIALDKRHPRDPAFPGMFRLLVEAAPLRKAENIPPLLGGELARAIFSGGNYPFSLLSRLIGRIRADGDINYLRAAMIKGLLVRKARLANTSEEITVSLNEDSTNIGYRLGRLFAVLEKAQLDALGKVNATIKDRFYGAASATPRAVFPRLIRLAQHHIAKAEYGVRLDKALGQILDDVHEFPAHLGLDDQGRFALGYYQQRNALYAKKEETA
ncbi:type I-C CRISPR-associated protein Cas8c/Csd1 [Megalodesulfovibrio paquesii]